MSKHINNFTAAGILLAALIVVTGSLWRVNRVVRTVLSRPVTAVAGMPIPTSKPNVPKPPVQKLPPYAGQAIGDIGTDPFIAKVPKDYLENHLKQLAELKVRLTQQPDDFNAWMDVAYLKKFYNNYLGARDAWEYANKIAPKNSIAFYNLGNLYGHDLKQYEKAEQYYLTAIKNDPKLPYQYITLSEFYAVFYTAKKDLADDVLKQGLAEVPDDSSLKEALANLEKK